MILLKPFLRKIQFIVPDTNTEFSIVISGEIFSEEAQESLSAQLDEQEIAFVRCLEVYVPHSDNTQIVAPCLPVIQKTNGKTQVALPSPTLPPATVPSVAQVDPLVPKFDEGATHQMPHGAMGQDVIKSLHSSTFVGTGPPTSVSQPPPAVTTASLLSSTAGNTLPGQPLLKGMSSERSRLLYPSTALTGGAASVQTAGPIPAMQTFEQAVGEVPSSKKQIRLKPGTVLFTSDPDRIPSDRLHPLPNEQHLIRRGGNGYIYSENVSWMTMAIKKTSYRSKEYAIITKLRHKNIMPLLAFVWGPENPENKRRYTVFHYLPKLTGDLARMVTDKEELLMSEFRKTHQWSGIEDSNAICTTANVELHKCPTLLLVANSSFIQVQVVPVGTNGFRAPECGMSIIANSPEALSPPVTTKCDIYSFGILSLRLFISTETPHSQRATAMMILRYHQERRLKQGSIDKRRHNFMRVQQEDIDKLLKVHVCLCGSLDGTKVPASFM